MAELRLAGRGAAPGLAQGVVSVLDAPARRTGRAAGSPAEERAALLGALEQARAEVEALAAATGGEAADMLGFQAAMLADDELARPALDAVAAGAPAPAAWEQAMAAEAAVYAGCGDPVMAARTADLDDMRDRVLAQLAPPGARAAPPPGAVILASDLPLSRFLALDWSRGGAIVLTEGSPGGHVAMLARARSVPMVVGLGVVGLGVLGLGAASAGALAGREALVDATAGEVTLDPDEGTRVAFAARLGEATAARGQAARFRAAPAVTADGTRILVNLNISDVAELDGLDPAICDGIGLVRTELLFHGVGGGASGRATGGAAGVAAGDTAGLPGEDVQHAAYRRIVEWAAGRPVVVRVLDAGGDKPVPGVTPAGESNPFLGLRGLRLLLRHPALFRTQLRALARAAAHGDVRVMLPMVTVPEELDAARALLDAAVHELAEEGVTARRPMLGIMVEVPAAAISVHRFGAEFFSIGSNDLTQYVTAAGRDIGSVASLADPLNPAVLSLVGTVARHGRAHGLGVSLCGDAAADPRCIPQLLAAGLRALSVAPDAVGRTKQAVAAVRLGLEAP